MDNDVYIPSFETMRVCVWLCYTSMCDMRVHLQVLPRDVSKRCQTGSQFGQNWGNYKLEQKLEGIHIGYATIRWVDEIHFAPLLLGIYRGSITPGFLGGAGFRPSAVSPELARGNARSAAEKPHLRGEPTA